MGTDQAYGPLSFPFGKVRLTVRCKLHHQAVDFHPQEDAMSILDSVQLSCSGADSDLYGLDEAQEALIATGSQMVRRAYKDTHPEEVAKYPGDWIGPTVQLDSLPASIRQRVREIQVEKEKRIRECYESWEVILEAVE